MFAIPATSPSICSSKVITVNYVLRVEVGVPCGFDPTVSMPIVCCTVPFRSTYGEPQQFGLPQEQLALPQGSEISYNTCLRMKSLILIVTLCM